jgi:hypothetical protein
MAQNEQKGLSGKLVQLKLMGLTEDDLSRVNDLESADALIKYLESKNKTQSKVPEQPQVKANQIPLPSTEPTNVRTNNKDEEEEFEDVGYEELHDPRQPNVARLNLMDKDLGRVLLLENDDMPEGGIF